MLNADSFKSTYQIMLEMSQVWDSMTQKDKLDALELMFGKRTANVGASIVENMSDAEKALETSINSAGSALAENEVVLDSIAGKTAQFKAQFEALSNSVINSDLIKGTIDTGSGLLGALTWAIDKMGSIPALATVAAGALSSIGNVGWLTIVERQIFIFKYAQPLLELAFILTIVDHVLKHEESAIGVDYPMAG